MIKATLAPGFELTIADRDADILRRLAGEIAEIGRLPVQERNKKLWRDVNNNKKDGIALLIRGNEIPWHEMNADGSLDLVTGDPFSRSIEQEFRRTLYQWRHCPCDMVVDPVFKSELVIMDGGFGVASQESLIRQGEGSEIFSHHYEPVIKTESDIEKIRNPVISHNEEMTEKLLGVRKELFGGIMEVKKCGPCFIFFAPWDELVTLWGAGNLMIDLVERPEMVHAGIRRYTDAWHARLDQYEALGLLSYDEGNYLTGSGALAYTDDLPGADFNPDRVKLKNLWGFSTAQIFGAVSPAMHEEFALAYERPLLERFGLSYYGCCEPLHDKVHILKSIPNLRKISVSPWADIAKTVERTGGGYVLSIKPSPAVFVGDWNPGRVRQDLIDSLEKTRGCAVEIILKDITTVGGRPDHLFEWAAIAREVVENFRKR